MQSVEAEGNTIDEAINGALELLRVDRDRVEIEILTDSSRGLFGIGGKKARVRATLRAPLWGGEKESGSDASSTGGADERETSGKSEDEWDLAASAHETAASQEEYREEQPSVPRASLAVPPEAAERGRDLLQEVLTLMGMQDVAAIESGADDGEVILQITGEFSGVIIGRHGQTIDAIEYIVNRLVAREFQNIGHIVVDAAGYRMRRRESLTEMALRLAEKARRERRTVALNPLSPRDRRVVHIALKNTHGITTRSHGAGLHRKLLIIPSTRRTGSSAERP